MLDIKQELMPIFYEHWDLVGVDKEKYEVNLNWEQYRTLEKYDMIRFITARDNDDLVGYFSAIISQSLHHADHKLAYCDMIYIKPDSRTAFGGRDLIRYAENQLKKMGVSTLGIASLVHVPFDKLLTRMGYSNTETLFQKHIGK
jgi:GNAT superfamily N-acetyltransferase